MARTIDDIKQEIRALSRNDQVRLVRALPEELEARSYTTSPHVVRAEIEIDLAAANDSVARHGSFANMAREHYEATDDDAV